MSKVYLAFYYKDRKIESLQTFWYRAFDTLTKLVTLGRYSHCEIAIGNGHGEYDCYSSSKRDGGVRAKRMKLPTDTWDLVDISHLVKSFDVVQFYTKTKGCDYDVIGLLSPVVGNIHDKDKYFCSEWCAEAINFVEPNKLSPSSLHRLVSKL